MPEIAVGLEDREFDLLADYALRHGCTVADAVRYAVSLMLRAEQCSDIAGDAVAEVLGKQM